MTDGYSGKIAFRFLFGLFRLEAAHLLCTFAASSGSKRHVITNLLLTTQKNYNYGSKQYSNADQR